MVSGISRSFAPGSLVYALATLSSLISADLAVVPLRRDRALLRLESSIFGRAVRTSCQAPLADAPVALRDRSSITVTSACDSSHGSSLRERGAAGRHVQAVVRRARSIRIGRAECAAITRWIARSSRWACSESASGRVGALVPAPRVRPTAPPEDRARRRRFSSPTSSASRRLGAQPMYRAPRYPTPPAEARRVPSGSAASRTTTDAEPIWARDDAGLRQRGHAAFAAGNVCRTRAARPGQGLPATSDRRVPRRARLETAYPTCSTEPGGRSSNLVEAQRRTSPERLRGCAAGSPRSLTPTLRRAVARAPISKSYDLEAPSGFEPL